MERIKLLDEAPEAAELVSRDNVVECGTALMDGRAVPVEHMVQVSVSAWAIERR